MDEIQKLLKRKAVFHCKPRGGGFQSRDFDVVHTCERLPESTEIPDWLPPSMHSLLKNIGTMVLFHPETGLDNGFRLFSPRECIQHLAIIRKVMADARETLKDSTPDESSQHEVWMNGLCPIAEVVQSGDYFALDTETAQDNDECPIVYLDHEYYFAGWLEPTDVEVVATDAISMVQFILEDPLQYLAAYWTGGNPYDQWFPESVSYSN